MRVALLACVACGRVNFDEIASPCSAQHTFCDDFDRTTPVEAPWSTAVITGGAVALATDRSVSPPGSLLVDLDFPLIGEASLELMLPAVTRSVHVEFDLDLELSTPAPAEVDLVQVRWVPLPAGCSDFGFFLVRDSTGEMSLQETTEGCPTRPTNANNLFTFPSGFTHVVIDIAIGLTATERLEVGGVEIVPTKLLGYEVPPASLLLVVGAPGGRQTTGPWRMRYDNVLIDVD